MSIAHRILHLEEAALPSTDMMEFIPGSEESITPTSTLEALTHHLYEEGEEDTTVTYDERASYQWH